MTQFRLFAIFALLSLCCAPLSFAMSVSPIVLDLQSNGSQSAGSISVNNPSETDLPVEVTIQEIQIDETGRIVSSVDASDDFLIMPPLATIPAERAQNFRIQYLGDPDLLKGRLFQYNVDQVPVTLDPSEETKIQIVYSISGLLTLSAAAAPSKLEVLSTEIVEDENGEPKAAITMLNPGDNYAYFSRGSLSVRHLAEDGRTLWREALSATRIEQEIGFGLVPPGAQRTITLPYTLLENTGEIRAEFTPGARQ